MRVTSKGESATRATRKLRQLLQDRNPIPGHDIVTLAEVPVGTVFLHPGRVEMLRQDDGVLVPGIGVLQFDPGTVVYRPLQQTREPPS